MKCYFDFQSKRRWFICVTKEMNGRIISIQLLRRKRGKKRTDKIRSTSNAKIHFVKLNFCWEFVLKTKKTKKKIVNFQWKCWLSFYQYKVSEIKIELNAWQSRVFCCIISFVYQLLDDWALSPIAAFEFVIIAQHYKNVFIRWVSCLLYGHLTQFMNSNHGVNHNKSHLVINYVQWKSIYSAEFYFRVLNFNGEITEIYGRNYRRTKTKKMKSRKINTKSERQKKMTK